MFLRCLAILVIIMGSALFCMFSGSVGCSGSATSSDTDTDAAGLTFPETCADIQEQVVDETGDRPENGTYTLYIDGDENQPWDVYCHNMRRAEPVEYLTVAEENNYSEIRSDDAVAVTSYRRLRIDPITLEINPLDATFSTNDFDSYEPTLPEGLESIPAGWAEFQSMSYNMSEGAETHVNLEGTAFVFSEDILDNDMSDFFCQVDSRTIMPESTEGTEVDVADDLTSFTLMAINTNSEAFDDVSTRLVADCVNLGPDATDFSVATWPLQYNP